MLLAYLDPGTGSVILQAVIAGFMGALLVVKMGWAKIKAGVRSIFSRADGKDDQTSD